MMSLRVRLWGIPSRISFQSGLVLGAGKNADCHTRRLIKISNIHGNYINKWYKIIWTPSMNENVADFCITVPCTLRRRCFQFHQTGSIPMPHGDWELSTIGAWKVRQTTHERGNFALCSHSAREFSLPVAKRCGICSPLPMRTGNS